VRRVLVLFVLVASAALAACGPGSGSDASRPKDVEITITRDFGAKQLRSTDFDDVPSGETVMRALERTYDVETRYSGGFVQSLEGLNGGTDAEGRSVDWFYYVNGVESSEGAAARKVYPGDRIWWDRHDWETAQRVPAVVGSWPEPFVNGVKGKRFPLTIACAGEERACDEVEARLSDEGVTRVSRTSLGTANGMKTLRILVGPWSELRKEAAASQLEKGPQTSGVYAIPHTDRIDLLDERGRVADSLSDGVGLVAATICCGQQATWIVTGVDDAGVAAAAAGLRSNILNNRFAVAIVRGRGQALPLRGDQ
jgi:hypothetical protein